jgi:hypothetical protein
MKEFTLDDGSVWTSHTLAEKLGCSVSCAGQRLRTHTKSVLVFREVGSRPPGKEYKKREYTLIENDQPVFTGTAREIGLKWDLIESTVYHRLRNGQRELNTITKPANNSYATNCRRGRPAKTIKESLKLRSFNNPLDRLWMGMKSA